jgi:hypothetical protein
MTTADHSLLPDAFADLKPLAARWARPTENERNAVRYAASAADFAAFHEALLPRLDALLGYLRDCPAHPEDPAQHNALMLACAYAEAAPHHELYSGSSEVPFSFDARRFVADHGDVSL